MSLWDSLAPSPPIDNLRAQFAAGEIAHSWLLLGPSGSGKRPAARAMAAAIDCPEEPGRGCGRCSTCLRIARHRHPDVHHVVPEGPLIPVDVIRESVLPEASRSAFEAKYRVFVIEEADRMNPPAQNALLKTLEEPPAGSYFILTSDNEDDLLETITSRCRIVRLEPVPEPVVIELLQKEGVSAEHARLAARLAEGDFDRARRLALDDATAQRRAFWLSIPRRMNGPGDALDAAAEILAESKDALKEHETLQKIEVKELAEALGEARGTAAARTALAKRHRRELRRLEESVLGDALTSLASFYRDVVAVRGGGHEAVTNLDLLDDLEMWAGSDISNTALLSAVERCVEARTSFTWNANQALAIEAALVELARLAPASARVGAGA